MLAHLGAMVRERFAPDLSRRFELYHTELRDHLQTAPSVAMVRGAAARLLLDNATQPGSEAASPYLFRFGVRHLLDAGRAADAATMAAGLVYQMQRLQALTTIGGDGGLREDWHAIGLAGARLADPAASWRRFWLTDGATFQPGAARDAAYELLERCLEYAPDKMVSEAADDYLASLPPAGLQKGAETS